jgi:periplasmic copper chaperone A
VLSILRNFARRPFVGTPLSPHDGRDIGGLWLGTRAASPYLNRASRKADGKGSLTMNTPRLVVAALALSALTACGEGAGDRQVLRVASGHVMAPATPDRPAAGYFTIEGGGAPVELVAVMTNFAQRTEMHQTVKENGMTMMKELSSAPVPVQGKLEFKPGANHLMIWNINGAAVRAGKLPMIFVFSNNERIQFDMKIKEAGKDGDAHAGH